MTNWTKESMLSHLQSGIATVQFTKVNGEKRTMSATLVEKLIEENTTNKDKNGNVGTNTPDVLANVKEDKRKTNPNLIVCFDLDKKDWRSYRVDSLISFDWVSTDGEY
jgi:hypothetical protein